jgi:hypothetical protein
MVRIYGDEAWFRALAAELMTHFPAASVEYGTYDDDTEDPTVHQCDILVCMVEPDPEKEDRAFRFLGRVVKYHGVYIYLATIVVGAECSPRREHFYLLGVAKYLDRQVPLQKIVEQVKSTLQKVWWYGVYQQELLALVLDPKQRIVRANQFARDRFGEKLVGSHYSVVDERFPASPTILSSNHPIIRSSDRATCDVFRMGTRCSEGGTEMRSGSFLSVHLCLRPTEDRYPPLC